jgi:hypothetical protein
MATNPSIPELFSMMPDRYRTGVLGAPRSYYFSVGPYKYTAVLKPDGAEVSEGNSIGKADVVLKTTEELFARMVIHGKMPGALDIARGRIKTNNPAALKQLRDLFDFSR